MSAEAPAPESTERRNRRQALILGGVVVGMFGFGFAMVPLYELVCQVAGWNNAGDITGARKLEQTEPSWVDQNRKVRVEFDFTRNQDLAWEIRPSLRSSQVHPGEFNTVSYHVVNRSDQVMTVQAVPGVTPWQATEYFRKIECFCFEQQTLAPGESAELPLRYVIDPDLPERFSVVTLSYTFMATDKNQQADAARVAPKAPG